MLRNSSKAVVLSIYFQKIWEYKNCLNDAVLFNDHVVLQPLHFAPDFWINVKQGNKETFFITSRDHFYVLNYLYMMLIGCLSLSGSRRIMQRTANRYITRILYLFLWNILINLKEFYKFREVCAKLNFSNKCNVIKLLTSHLGHGKRHNMMIIMMINFLQGGTWRLLMSEFYETML